MTNIADLKVRRADANDAQRVRDLTRRAYQHWIAVLGREPQPMTANYESAVIDHQIDLFETGEQIVGLIEMYPTADYLMIENVAVDPNFQKLGIGRKLLQHAGLVARQVGLSEVRLYTNALMQTNIAYYQRFGFEEFRRDTTEEWGTVVHMKKH